MRPCNIIIGLLFLLCEASFAEVFVCKDPKTGQTTFTDKACGTSGERAYVPLHEANGMKPPGKTPFPESRQQQTNRPTAAFINDGYDPARDSYKRQRLSLQRQAEHASSAANRADAKRKLKALDSQYKTSQKIAGSTKQQYNRQSTMLRERLDSSRSYEERAKAKRDIAELNRKHGGNDPFASERAVSSAPIVTQAPAPPKPTVITNCDAAGCWDNVGGRYNKGAGNTYFPPTGGACQRVGGQMICN